MVGRFVLSRNDRGVRRHPASFPNEASTRGSRASVSDVPYWPPIRLSDTPGGNGASSTFTQPNMDRPPKYRYASHFKKTANGRWGRIGSKKGEAVKVQPQGRFKANGKIDV